MQKTYVCCTILGDEGFRLVAKRAERPRVGRCLGNLNESPSSLSPSVPPSLPPSLPPYLFFFYYPDVFI